MESENEGLIATLRLEGIQNETVLSAMAAVDRADFVPLNLKAYAYVDEALPIQCGQTISQPFVVARMTELLLGPKKRLNKILEIGTGSGYQAAVLSKIVTDVYTIERIEALYAACEELLQRLHYSNIHLRYGDGYLGWPEFAPFEGILITAALDEIPQTLLQQLDPNGGRLIAPVGSALGWQELQFIERQQDDYRVKPLDIVTFVPMLPGVTKR